MDATTELESRKTGRPAAPPRVRGLPLLGSGIELASDPLGFLDRISREHGDVVEFGMLGKRVWLLNHPDAIEQMLVSAREQTIKDNLTRQLSWFLGDGLLVSEGAFWRKQRRLAQPAFHRRRIEAYGDAMVRHAERATVAWKTGEARDLHKDLLRLTLDIVAETLFSVSVAEVARKIEWSLEVLLGRFSGAGVFFPIALPTPGNFKVKRAVRQLDEIVYGIIRERRASGADRGDLLSMLLAATSDEDGGMDDVQLRNECITLMLAGHETTALTLTFCFHLLAQHPQVMAKLVGEIESVLGDRPARAGDLPMLKYADAVVRESMRLYPPAWAIGRETIARCTIGGYEVPVGTQLWAAQWVVHRDARWFPEPEAFQPERWQNDLARTLPRQAYFPFGGGPRICIGNTFATMEAVLILVTLARRFSFAHAAPERPLELVPSVTLRPRNGLPMIPTAR